MFQQFRSHGPFVRIWLKASATDMTKKIMLIRETENTMLIELPSITFDNTPAV